MKYASTASKALPLICLTVSLAASLALFIIRDRTYIGKLPSLLRRYRNESQVTVQVLSSLLSMAQMLVLTSLVNFAARLELFDSPTLIDSLSFWSALSIPRFDRALPPIKLLLVVLTLLLGMVLGALWAGSLTLLSVTMSQNDGRVLVPLFNSTLGRTMYPDQVVGTIVVQCANNQTSDPRGPSYPPLDNCIVLSKLPNLIMKATTATNVTDPGQYPKIDNSTWTYRGRSHGKGSLAGLLDVTDAKIETGDLGFSYQESGYSPRVNCSKQNVTLFPFREIYHATKSGQLNLWSANTVVLDTQNVTIPPFHLASAAYNGFNSGPFGYFAWTAFTVNDTQHYLATSSQPNSWSAHGPENILCELHFVPMTFNVNVSKVDQSIAVTHLQTIENFNQVSNIANTIINGLDLVSRMSSSSLAFSSLHTAVGSNQRAAQLAYSGVDNQTAWVYSLQDGITGIADDLLTYQGILAISGSDNQSVWQPAQRHFAAVRVGQTSYQIAQLIINIVLCMAYMYEAFRTRCWRRLPNFDFLDIKSFALALSSSDKPLEQATGRSRSRLSLGWSVKDRTKLLAYHDERSRPRLRFSSDTEERERLTSRTEQSFYLLGDLDFQRSRRSAAQSRENVMQPSTIL